VAINLFGDVVFHGQTGASVKAVFTQNGLVAKVGDIPRMFTVGPN
jgi:hypothetical protein